jgi:hypothetical protein
MPNLKSEWLICGNQHQRCVQTTFPLNICKGDVCRQRKNAKERNSFEIAKRPETSEGTTSAGKGCRVIEPDF